MATTKSTTPRRKAAQSAQEHPAAQVVQFLGMSQTAPDAPL